MGNQLDPWYDRIILKYDAGENGKNRRSGPKRRR